MAHLKLDFDDGAFESCGYGCNGTGAIKGLVCDYCAGTGKKFRTYNIAQLKRILEKVRYDMWSANEATVDDNITGPSFDEAIMCIAHELGFKQKESD